MTWNYRIIDWEEDGGYMAIHEVFYDSKGEVEFYTERPIEVAGGNKTEILNQLGMMTKDAKKHPILKKSELPGGKDQEEA